MNLPPKGNTLTWYHLLSRQYHIFDTIKTCFR